MKRITPEEAVRVYEAKNAYALRGTFYSRLWREDLGHVRCGCIVGVFATRLRELDIQEPDNRPMTSILEDRMFDEGYDRDYVAGLEDGFDFQEPACNMGPHYDAGHEDGQACFLALLEAGRTFAKPEEMVAHI